MVVGQSVIDNGSSTETVMVLVVHRYVAASALALAMIGISRIAIDTSKGPIVTVRNLLTKLVSAGI